MVKNKITEKMKIKNKKIKPRTKKEIFNSFSLKIGKFLGKLNVSPNVFTILALVFAIFASVFIINKKFLFGALFFLISAFLDFVDGAVARTTGKVTLFGGFFDTIIDRYVESIIIFSLLFVPLPKIIFSTHVWLFLILFGSLMTTYIKAAAKEKNLISEELKGGFFGRAERMAILFTGLIFGNFFPIVFSYILVFLAIITNVAAIQRFFLAKKELKKQKQQKNKNNKKQLKR